MATVKKQLSLGNMKRFDKSKLPVTPTEDESRYDCNYAYTQRVYVCTYKDIHFNVVVINALLGIGEVGMEIDDAQFKSKAALVRFYREVKQLVIVPL